MKCLCLPNRENGNMTEVDHLRLFRNRPDIRWRYRVHEQILHGIRATRGDVRWADVVIQHTGYQDPAHRKKKIERDTRLLLLDQAEFPNDGNALWNRYFRLCRGKERASGSWAQRLPVQHLQ